MGTSKNYSSPKTARWNAVRSCYTNKKIPESRVVSEVWRAATQENSQLQSMLNSEIVYKCNEIVQNSRNPFEAQQKYISELISSKQSSIITEFAKRAIAQSYQGPDPSSEWRKNFISEVTNYFVSRDIAGFVGKDSRNDNIGQLNTFKDNLKSIVKDTINSIKLSPKDHTEWKNYIQISLTKIKNKDE